MRNPWSHAIPAASIVVLCCTSVVTTGCNDEAARSGSGSRIRDSVPTTIVPDSARRPDSGRAGIESDSIDSGNVSTTGIGIRRSTIIDLFPVEWSRSDSVKGEEHYAGMTGGVRIDLYGPESGLDMASIDIHDDLIAGEKPAVRLEVLQLFAHTINPASVPWLRENLDRALAGDIVADTLLGNQHAWFRYTKRTPTTGRIRLTFTATP